MSTVQETCKTCNKPIKSIQTQLPHGGFITYVWNCGHIEVKPKPTVAKDNIIPPAAPYVIPDYSDLKVPPPTKKELYEDLDRWVSEGGAYKKSPEQIEAEERYRRWQDKSFHSVDGSEQHAYEYQFECTEFLERVRCRALIGDGTGVVKTIEAALVIKRNLAILSPVLVIVPGSIIFQWANKIRSWVSMSIGTVMPIISRDHIMPGFQVYVISRDLLSRNGVLDKIKLLNIKCVIVDEVQGFKDMDSARTKALFKLMKGLNGKPIDYFIPMSGTWIKNRLIEGFPVLHLLDPLGFPSETAFSKRYVDPFTGGLNKYASDEFKYKTKDLIIRREKHDVLKDLPPLTRDFQLIEIEDEDIKKSYNHQLGLFNSYLKNNIEEVKSNALLGWLAKLRAITGMAKVSYAMEWINEFLDSTDDTIGIAIHHNDVRDLLYQVFNTRGLNPIKISGEDNSYRKAEKVREFNLGKSRTLIINALSGGVGLDGLQSCANALVLEREWSSADEEQFEARFHRDGQKRAVTVTYFLAKGTIDEFFHEMVVKKRNILNSVGIGAAEDPMNHLESLKEFAEFVASHTI